MVKIWAGAGANHSIVAIRYHHLLLSHADLVPARVVKPIDHVLEGCASDGRKLRDEVLLSPWFHASETVHSLDVMTGSLPIDLPFSSELKIEILY